MRATFAAVVVLLLTLGTTAVGQGQPSVRHVIAFHELPGHEVGDSYDGAKVVRIDASLGFFVVSTSDPEWPERQRADPNVRYVEADPQRSLLLLTPNDPQFASQYGPQRVRAPAAWDTSLGSTDAAVCIVDTGVRHTHQDLAARWRGGRDFVNNDNDPNDDHGHGTHVAGTAAAGVHNGKNVAGIGNAAMYGVKVLNSGGSGSLSAVASGIAWCADNGPRQTVISLSLGSSGTQQVLTDAVNYAAGKGNLLVAAAGNSGPCSNCILYPAKYANVVAVTCTDSAGNQCSFSSDGPESDLAAPGASILSTCRSSDTATCSMSGTSMSTPHVSGVAALVWSQATALLATELRDCLYASAEDLGAWGWDQLFGHGEVDAKGAMDRCGIRSGLQESFDGGAAGWTTTGLWHVTDRRSASAPNSAWYGQAATGTYDTGGANAGTLTSPRFRVPPLQAALTFSSWHATDGHPARDLKTVQVTTDAGATWQPLLTVPGAAAPWTGFQTSLAAYGGMTAQLRWTFDTVDPFDNGFEGWFVDDVLVVGNDPPVACAVAVPAAGPLGTVFQFDSSCSSDLQQAGATLERRWDFEDDGVYDTTFSTTPTASRSYPTMGIRTVRVELRDAGGLTSSTTLQVVVNSPPNACVTATPIHGSAVQPFHFDASCSSDLETPHASLQVRWDWQSDGVYDTAYSTTKTYDIIFGGLGPRTVTVQVLDGHGSTATARVTVTLHAACVVGICVL